MATASSRRWFVAGDLNGFFGLVVDNLSILGFIAAALIGHLRFSGRRGVSRACSPAPRFGVLVGNLIYTWMARRLARADRSRRRHRDAAGPGRADQHRHGAAGAGAGVRRRSSSRAWTRRPAAIATWQLGMASLIVMGTLKLVLSFFGDAITRAGAARGTARFDRRRGAGAARLPAADRNAALAGSGLRHVRPAAVRAGRQGQTAGADARRAAGLHRRHGAVLRPGPGRSGYAGISRCPMRRRCIFTLAVADARIPRRPAGTPCRICRCCCRSAC